MTESRDILRPTTLGERGNAFYVAMDGPTEDNPVRLVLIVETARLLDTLEALNNVINGDDEFLIREVGDDGEIIVKVDSAVGMRKQHVLALRTLTADLKHAGHHESPADTATPEDMPDRTDEIAQRRRNRKMAR
jgi:hypothetical protein